MKGTHSLEELRNYPGFNMFKTGIVMTKYGSSTINYWVEMSNGLWKNYKCRTL